MVSLNKTATLWNTRLVARGRRAQRTGMAAPDGPLPGPDCCFFICNICCYVAC